MLQQNHELRRRFRIDRLEERIAPTSMGFGGGFHHHSGGGSSDPYTPVVTTVTVQNDPGHQTSWTFVGGDLSGTSTTNNPGGISDPITTEIPAGTPYTYDGGGYTVSYYTPPPAVSATGSM